MRGSLAAFGLETTIARLTTKSSPQRITLKTDPAATIVPTHPSAAVLARLNLKYLHGLNVRFGSPAHARASGT